MVNLRFIILLVYVSKVACTPAANTDCNAVYNSYYYGSEYQQSDNGNAQVPLAAGPPGKAGMKGEKGERGRRGQKGEPGENVTERDRISALEQQLREVTKLDAVSCAHMTETATNGRYRINPTQQYGEWFFVDCDFRSSSAVTLVHHDTTSEMEADSECDTSLCYRRDVTYQATDRQLRALIDVSSECKQFIKYRCFDSTLGYAGWINSHGIQKRNWGGSNRAGYCACGEAGTCGHGQSQCNCQLSDPEWTEDEGYWTNKDELPVKALLFGDLGTDSHGGTPHDEQGFFTLGKLECSGRA